ncbi:carbohydrate kinase [Synechococcus sp. AH-603-M21]|nr:carbohydrate kinase [Synechococcus sp. AH-603-M21]
MGDLSVLAPRVLCLGEALVDRLGPLGGDPSTALAADCDDRLGGAPANVACALARLGTPVGLIGRLGEDAIGAAFRDLFRQRDVAVQALQSDASHPSRVVLVRRHANGERVFQGFAGDQDLGFADQMLDRGELEQMWPGLIEQARWLLVGTIPLATRASADSLHWVLAQAKAAGLALAVDVNWRPTFWNPEADPAAGPTADAKALIQPLLEQASLLKLAQEEALWFFGSDDPAAIAAELPQQPDVVVTDGAAPVRWFIAKEAGSMPVFPPAQVIDTTGAGDAFTAGLLHCWDRPVTERLRFASACGALVCGGAGAIDPQPREQDVSTFLKEWV